MSTPNEAGKPHSSEGLAASAQNIWDAMQRNPERAQHTLYVELGRLLRKTNAN